MRRIVRLSGLLIGLALLASLAGGVSLAAAQTQGPNPQRDELTARLGGSRQDFETKYGQATADVASFVFPAAATYDIKGYGHVVAYFDQNQLLFLQLTPARAADKSGYASDPADWSVSKGTELAGRFLPSDAKMGTATDLNGDKLLPCTSTALGSAVAQGVYSAYHLNGKAGDCQAILHLDSDGNVFLIDVGLGNGGTASTTSPISVPIKAEGTATPGGNTPSIPVPPVGTATTPQGQGTATASNDTSYLVKILTEMVQLKTSRDTFSSLLNNPQPNDANWKSQLDGVFSTWKQLYQDAQGLTPPADLQAFHQKYLQMLQLYNQAADDITNALANQDSSLLDKAQGEINQAADLYNQIVDELQQKFPSSSSTPSATQ